MYKEAVEKYIDTIGFLNPSYVIQKFLDVQRLESLTTYLKALRDKSGNANMNFRGE